MFKDRDLIGDIIAIVFIGIVISVTYQTMDSLKTFNSLDKTSIVRSIIDNK